MTPDPPAAGTGRAAPRSLKWQILLPFLALGSFVVAALAAVVWLRTDNLVGNAGAAVEAVVQDDMIHDLGLFLRVLDNLIDDKLEEMAVEARSLLRRGDVISFLEKYQTEPLYLRLRETSLETDLDFAVLFDRAGEVVAAYPEDASERLIGREARSAGSLGGLLGRLDPVEGERRTVTGLLTLPPPLAVALDAGDVGMERPGGPAMVALVSVLDDFGEPIGAYFGGRLLQGRSTLLDVLRRTTGADFAFYHRGRALASTTGGLETAADGADLSRLPPDGGPLFMQALFGEGLVPVCKTLADLGGDTGVAACAAFPAAKLSTAKKTVSDIGQASRQGILAWLLAAGGGGAAVFAAAALMLANRQSRSLSAMTDIVSSIADDDLDVPIPEFGDSAEVTQLGRALLIFRENAVIRRSMETELSHSLEQQRQMNEMQRRFVSMVSHEFRTPLAIIDSTAQRIVRRLNGMSRDELSARMEKIRKAIVRMSLLIETTLISSRVHEGAIRFEHVECDLAEVIGRARDKQRDLSASHAIRLDLEHLPARIYSDPVLLEHVFDNLISNAVKYSPNAREVQVEGHAEGGEAVVSVRDFGIGIPADEIGEIFKSYFRGANVTDIAGTGIGLNIVKEIVQTAGGSIAVESRPGEGSLFTVRLPVAGKPGVTEGG